MTPTAHLPAPRTGPDHLRELERLRLRALVARDMATAWGLHSPAFQLVTPGGAAFTREQYLGKIESGTLRYLRWEPGEIAVRMGVGIAVLRYQATLQLQADDGPGTPLRCWHIDSYEASEDGTWQVVWSQATAIRPPDTAAPAPAEVETRPAAPDPEA